MSDIQPDTRPPASPPSASPASRSGRKWLPLTLVVAALVAGGWWWQHHDSKSANTAASGAGAHAGGGKGGARGAGAPVAVGVAPVVQQDAPLELSALGTVSAGNTTTVRARVDGLLEKVLFQEGQFVKQGQLIAVLDARAAQAALLQAQGQLMRDQAVLQNARLDLKRYQQLWAQNSIARQQLDTQAALVKQYEGTVRVDQGVVQNAQVQMSYTRVTAPVSGVIGLRQADPGNMVHTTDTNGIAVITQTRPIHVTFALPESSMRRLQQARSDRPGGALGVEAWSRDNTRKLASGTLLAVDNQINASTGTLELKARFANDNQQLFPNQFVNVRLELGQVNGAIMVPSAAIQIGKVGSYVYVVQPDQTVKVVAVQTGDSSGTSTIITQGLQAGQTVVVDGLDKLRDGAAIQRVDRAAQAASADSSGAAHAHRHGASGAEPAASAATPSAAAAPASRAVWAASAGASHAR